MEHNCGTHFAQHLRGMHANLGADVPVFLDCQVVQTKLTVDRVPFFLNILYWNIWNIAQEHGTTRILWPQIVFQLCPFHVEHCGTLWNIFSERWLAPPLES